MISPTPKALLVLCALLAPPSLGAGPVDGPPRPVFDPRGFGAKGDGRTNDREALQRAIGACTGSGGSVYLHDGTFLTGQITLGTNMTLFIAPTATLMGIQSVDEGEYPARQAGTANTTNDPCQRRLIYGERLVHVRITGGGTIDGQGDFAPWRSAGRKVPERLRPSILEIACSQDVEVSHLTLRRPGMWTQVYLECAGLVLRGLSVDTGNLPSNRDGMDICDCHDVLVEDCALRSQDDGICFKSGSAYGCSNIVVRRCVVDKLGVSAGNCLKFGTASQGSLTQVVCSDLKLRNTGNTAVTLESVDGAAIDHVEVRDCEVSGAAQVISVILGHRRGTIGSVSHLVFRNIRSASGAKPIACLLTGAAGHPLRDLQFIGVNLRFPGGVTHPAAQTPEYGGDYPEGTHFGTLPAYGVFLRHVEGATFTDCSFSTDQPDARPWLVTDDAAGVEQARVAASGTPPR